MKILLDTHVFLWAITNNRHLSASHQALYTDEGNDLHLSVASVWEMLIKWGIGKLPLPQSPTAWLARQLEKNRINLLGIRLSHMTELEGLPPLHKDPFDRMIVAQARAEKMPILTADPKIHEYDVAIL